VAVPCGSFWPLLAPFGRQVEKLKDTELVLKKTIDASNEASRQSAADQEVSCHELRRCVAASLFLQRFKG